MANMSKRPPALSRHAVTAAWDEEEQGERISEARRLKLELIRPNPWQPRQHADAGRLAELTADVKARGILEPILVRPIPKEKQEGKARYEVVAGERRYRAALGAELKDVPVIIRKDMTDEEAREAALVENLLREDLDIEDEARFLMFLYEEKGSLRAVGEAIHKSYQYVNRRIKLLERPRALLAYRDGLINLDYLIENFTKDLVEADEIALIEAAAGQQNDSALEDEGITPRNNERESDMEEVRFLATRSSFKPFHKLQLHVRKLTSGSVEKVPAEERPRLRETVHELIEELALLEARLAEGE